MPAAKQARAAKKRRKAADKKKPEVKEVVTPPVERRETVRVAFEFGSADGYHESHAVQSKVDGRPMDELASLIGIVLGNMGNAIEILTDAIFDRIDCEHEPLAYANTPAVIKKMEWCAGALRQRYDIPDPSGMADFRDPTPLSVRVLEQLGFVRQVKMCGAEYWLKTLVWSGRFVDEFEGDWFACRCLPSVNEVYDGQIPKRLAPKTVGELRWLAFRCGVVLNEPKAGERLIP